MIIMILTIAIIMIAWIAPIGSCEHAVGIWIVVAA
jgi:hypothetical protein